MESLIGIIVEQYEDYYLLKAKDGSLHKVYNYFKTPPVIGTRVAAVFSKIDNKHFIVARDY